jgi:hypothetical protein
MIIKEYIEFDLNQISHVLGTLGIDKLNVFCIDSVKGVNRKVLNNPSHLQYIELGVEDFIELLNNPEANFMDYNKDSLYIIRNSSYSDVKLLFKSINSYNINIGRGGGQKYHMTSPLELRFYSYLMAICNLNYKKVCYINDFNHIPKIRYLPFLK